MLGLSGVAERAFGRTPSAPRSEDRFGTLYMGGVWEPKKEIPVGNHDPLAAGPISARLLGLLPSRPGSKDRNRKAFELGQEAARKAAENQGFCLANESYLELLG